LIAGGGPVGLLCAWLLARQGIPVRLFDNNDGLQADPRAATTHPATLDLLAQDGLVEDMARVGLVAPIFSSGIGLPTDLWRSLITPFSHGIPSILLLFNVSSTRPPSSS
jgi:predicted NAD/FAD-dependent oxidoreductase